jgi:outer membrane protein
MKKIFVIAIMMTTAVTAGLAQFTNKGTFLLGGSTNLNFGADTEKSKSGGSTSTDGKTTSFSLEPSAGYFFMDNLAVGAGLGLSTSTYKPDGGGLKYNSSTVSLSPFARYYFDKFYAQGAFQFGSQKSELTSGSTTETSKDAISGWSLAGGYVILLNESVSLEPQVGYRSIGYKDKDSDDKDISSGLFVRLGVFIYLSK